MISKLLNYFFPKVISKSISEVRAEVKSDNNLILVVKKYGKLFIVSDNVDVLIFAQYQPDGKIIIVNKNCYDYVKKWVDENRCELEKLMKPVLIDGHSFVPYWRDDHFKRISNMLSKESGFVNHKIFKGFSCHEIGISLNACGY